MNDFGRIFRVTLFGESHGAAVGVVIDGCPAGIPLPEDIFTEDLSRRKSGIIGTTPRFEEDIPEIISGIFNGFSTGAPITILFRNENIRSTDYQNLIDIPRPGHADFVAMKKYGDFADLRGGGHFSGRLTAALTAAGVIAKQIIKPIIIIAKLTQAGGSENIEEAVNKAINSHNSIGGIIECCAQNLPIGIGEPFFDGMESIISHAVFAIPGIKGIEFGSGFEAAKMTGLKHNDLIISEFGATKTNHAGGINGGISNGNEFYFRVAVKPTASIELPQETFNMKTRKIETLHIKGRHDTCFALRIPPVVEAATAISLADLMLQCGENQKRR